VFLAAADRVCAPSGGYAVLECFPTSSWRSSGLEPLPAKSRRPELGPPAAALAAAYALPPVRPGVASHDDLQALVAALAGAAAAGGPATPVPRGAPARLAVDGRGVPRRVEGLIWDVRPPGAGGPR